MKESKESPAPVGGKIEVKDLGLIDYQEAWEIQRSLVAGLSEPSSTSGMNQADSTLLMLEHPHIYTLGRRAKEGQNVMDAGEVPVLEVERGGDVTYHGPGQLVAYPIVRLSKPWQDVRRFVLALEEAIIDCVAHWDIKAGLRYKEVGVWVVLNREGQLMAVPTIERQKATVNSQGVYQLPAGLNWRKLASVGVAIKKWVTYHGLALNVNPDMSYFGRINPCGFEAGVMTSMAQLIGKEVTVEDVKPVLAKYLAEKFRVELIL